MSEIFIDEKKLGEKIDAIVPPVSEDPEYYKAVAHLWATSGATHEQIALMMGREIKEIEQILSLDRIKDLVSNIRKKAAGRDHERRFRELLPDAIQVTEVVMNDKSVKPGTRLSAAFGVMDRALGKPNQKIEVGGSTLRQFLDRLDQIERKSLEDAIVVSPKDINNVEEGEIVEQVDPAEKWVKENLK